MQHPWNTQNEVHVQIVNNYQSLTIVTNSHISGVTRDVDPPLNLIVIKIHI